MSIKTDTRRFPAASQALTVRATTFSDRARAVIITNQPTYNAVCELLGGIKGLRAEAERQYRPAIKATDVAHKASLKVLQDVDDPLKQAECICKGKIATWDTEQRRIELEHKRLAEEKARREQEAERQRLVDELRKAQALEEKKKLATLQRAEKLGADDDTLDAIINRPAPVVDEIKAVLDCPVVMAPIRTVPVYERTSGVSIAKVYKAEVTNIKLLASAVASGTVPENYIEANMVTLNAMMRASKGGMQIPGVRCIEESTVRDGRK